VASINWQSGGSILPSTFVMANYPIDYQVKTADGTQPIIGIAQEGTHNFPGSPGDLGYAATSGQFLNVYQDPEYNECLLVIGAAVSGGQALVSDSQGRAIPFVPGSSTAQYVGAEARDSGSTVGQLIRAVPKNDIVGRMT
jgi:hypothetical protein